MYNPLKNTIMNTVNILGLDPNRTQNTIVSLQQLLADFQVYYTNLRGLHWNIKGPAFFTLHAQFERMYDDVAAKVDEIAERILTLGGTPENRFSGYLQQAEIKEVAGVDTADGALRLILDTLQVLIARERAILSAASEAGDEGTVALMSDYLREQEKSVWMLTASLQQ